MIGLFEEIFKDYWDFDIVFRINYIIGGHTPLPP